MPDLPKAPDGQYLLDREVVAHILGVSRATVNNWLDEENPIPRDDRGRYPARDLGKWIRNVQTLKLGRGGMGRPYMPPGVVLASEVEKDPHDPSQGTFNQQKLRHEAAKADRVEMENEKMRGTLVSAVEVEAAWAEILSRVRSRMMQTPYLVAMRTVGKKDMNEILELTQEIVRDALTEMSEDWKDGIEDDEDVVD